MQYSTVAKDELDIVKSFMPSQLTEAELTAIIDSACGDMTMPETMKYLKTTYGAKVDMRMASMLAK